MKVRSEWMLAGVVALSGCTPAGSGGNAAGRAAGSVTEQEQLVGAWQLAWLEGPGPDGKNQRTTDAKGSLIYTADGVVSVQVMFAQAQAAPANAPVQYAQDGYEASFGRYVVDTAAGTVTHHYEGSLVRALLGQDFPRRYEFVDGRLIIRSTRPDEKWSVAWQR
jgi:hypothetical protein